MDRPIDYCPQCEPGGRLGEILNDYTGEWVTCPHVLRWQVESHEGQLKRLAHIAGIKMGDDSIYVDPDAAQDDRQVWLAIMCAVAPVLEQADKEPRA